MKYIGPHRRKEEHTLRKVQDERGDDQCFAVSDGVGLIHKRKMCGSTGATCGGGYRRCTVWLHKVGVE